jgi:predicted dehydrogenase
MKSGRTVQLDASWAAAMGENDANGVQLYGSEGGATTNPARLFRPGRDGYEAIDLRSTTALASDNRMAHFVDVVLGRAKPFVRPEQSLVVQQVLDAIYASARTGREIRFR